MWEQNGFVRELEGVLAWEQILAVVSTLSIAFEACSERIALGGSYA
jgi:hypothetical protein